MTDFTFFFWLISTIDFNGMLKFQHGIDVYGGAIV